MSKLSADLRSSSAGPGHSAFDGVIGTMITTVFTSGDPHGRGSPSGTIKVLHYRAVG